MGGPTENLGKDNTAMDVRRMVRRGGEECKAVRFLKGHTETKNRGSGVGTIQFKVKEANRRRAGMEINLDRRVLSIDVLEEERKRCLSVIPDHEYIVLKSEPNARRKWRGAKDGGLPFAQI